MSTFTPRPMPPRMFCSGTTQSRNTSSQVFEPRMPSLSSFCAVEKPGKPFSMMKAVMPRDPALTSVLAYTTKTSASGPLVIHILLPLRTNLPPLNSALSRMLTTSEPAPGSDIAKAPTCSPEISRGRYFRFCSALPLRLIWFTHRLECAP